jgi:hypothetical protein
MIPDHSVDFAFSFDSLLHVEADLIEAYLNQLAVKLKPTGAGLIHHSNIGTYVNSSTGKLPFYFDNTNNGSNCALKALPRTDLKSPARKQGCSALFRR